MAMTMCMATPMRRFVSMPMLTCASLTMAARERLRIPKRVRMLMSMCAGKLTSAPAIMFILTPTGTAIVMSMTRVKAMVKATVIKDRHRHHHSFFYVLHLPARTNAHIRDGHIQHVCGHHGRPRSHVMRFDLESKVPLVLKRGDPTTEMGLHCDGI